MLLKFIILQACNEVNFFKLIICFIVGLIRTLYGITPSQVLKQNLLCLDDLQNIFIISLHRKQVKRSTTVTLFNLTILQLSFAWLTYL